MNIYRYPLFEPNYGFITKQTRDNYIKYGINIKRIPKSASKSPIINSLSASNNLTYPIQFWQLYSVLGKQRILNIVRNFYERVFTCDHWFLSVFECIGDIEHHITTQANLWIDVMGGGPCYRGGEFRLGFHHIHNAHGIMNDKGATQWVSLMVDALDTSADHMTDDPRVRASINTFLAFFLSKYAAEFGFDDDKAFGEINPPFEL